MVSAIPAGFAAVTPQLTVSDAGKAMDFYREAFGAQEVLRVSMPGGSMVMHGEIKIGGCMIMVAGANPAMGCVGPSAEHPSTVTVHIYCEDVDGAFARATAAGCETIMGLHDAFWGDRFAMVMDPFGQRWSMARHMEDLTSEQIAERAMAMFGQDGCGGEGQGPA
ncbi:MAG: VOC family protein [Planctomycetota bacterium]|nr:MAG: VOC family protein [Planctomycetota bacterium]